MGGKPFKPRRCDDVESLLIIKVDYLTIARRHTVFYSPYTTAALFMNREKSVSWRVFQTTSCSRGDNVFVSSQASVLSLNKKSTALLLQRKGKEKIERK